MERKPDDGYRGLLRNPLTGRVFKANHVTARRSDLERVRGPLPEDAEPVVVTGSDNVPAVTAAPEEQVTTDSSAASDALNELLQQARLAEDKAQLKSIGAQLGLKLTANMNVKTMRDRIEKQVEEINLATGG